MEEKKIQTKIYGKDGQFQFYYNGTIAEMVAQHGTSGLLRWEKIGKLEEKEQEFSR